MKSTLSLPYFLPTKHTGELGNVFFYNASVEIVRYELPEHLNADDKINASPIAFPNTIMEGSSYEAARLQQIRKLSQKRHTLIPSK